MQNKPFPLIIPYFEKKPKISPNSFIAPGAIVIGDVEIGDGSGVWFNSVIRGDVAYIKIGKNSNIQDSSTIHVTRNGHPTIIGDNVTIGHGCIIHACLIESLTFVGMGSIIMDDAVIETEGMLAAGSMLTKGKKIKRGELWAGSPAKFFRTMSEDETKYIMTSANNYKQHAEEYRKIMQNLKSTV